MEAHILLSDQTSQIMYHYGSKGFYDSKSILEYIGEDINIVFGVVQNTCISNQLWPKKAQLLALIQLLTES